MMLGQLKFKYISLPNKLIYFQLLIILTVTCPDIFSTPILNYQLFSLTLSISLKFPLPHSISLSLSQSLSHSLTLSISLFLLASLTYSLSSYGSLSFSLIMSFHLTFSLPLTLFQFLSLTSLLSHSMEDAMPSPYHTLSLYYFSPSRSPYLLFPPRLIP